MTEITANSHLETDHQLLSGCRDDVLRKVNGAWKVPSARSCSTPTSCSTRTSASSSKGETQSVRRLPALSEVAFLGAEMLVDSRKTLITDKRFDSNESNTRFANHVFVRLVAMGRTFTKVDFRYTFFDACYLRNCQFDSCDFTGCRFLNTQLPGAKFSGCKFDYATFEKTLIDARVLDTECPGLENLKMRFARSLRTNFQQLGDADAVNKAMRVELTATEVHLKKAWQSNESYYRSHHPGVLSRALAFLEWLRFKVLDFIWGNGENLFRLLRFVLIVLALMALGDVAFDGDPARVGSYVASFIKSFAIFFGTLIPDDYGKAYLAVITCFRLVAVGFFLSIIIKKSSRR